MKCVVLTGDIVGSTRLHPDQLNAAFGMLRLSLEKLQNLSGQSTHVGIDRFRGDSWQCIIQAPELALRACLIARSALLGLHPSCDTRIAAAIGAVSDLSDQGIGASDGWAFRASGRHLEELNNANRMGMVFESISPEFTMFSESICSALNLIIQGWTPKRAAVMSAFLQLDYSNQSSLADHFGVSQQTINQHLKVAGGANLQLIINNFEQLVLGRDKGVHKLREVI